MAQVVPDASALLALLFREPGGESVFALLEDAVIGTVNLAEVLSKQQDYGVAADHAWSTIQLLQLNVVEFSRELAQRTSALRAFTRNNGLSLGDRACLALAQQLRLPAVEPV